MFTLGFKKISEELAHGGVADNMPDSAFNETSINKGMKVEREHTKNKKLQKEIAKDHLTEDPKYYGKLAKMEKKASLFSKAKNKASASKLAELGKHLHTYRKDYMMGAGTTAAVSSAVSMKKRENKK